MSYIDKEAFIEDIKAEITNLKLNGLKGTPRPCDELYGFIERIEAQPTADVVEVVRCKDCKHCMESEKTDRLFCVYHYEGYIEVFENEFCSCGERKENGT